MYGNIEGVWKTLEKVWDAAPLKKKGLIIYEKLWQSSLRLCSSLKELQNATLSKRATQRWMFVANTAFSPLFCFFYDHSEQEKTHLTLQTIHQVGSSLVIQGVIPTAMIKHPQKAHFILIQRARKKCTMSGRGKTNGKAKAKTHSSHAGLQFPVDRVHRLLRKGKHVWARAPVYLAAVLEYLRS